MAETSDDRLIGQLIDRRYRVVRKLGGGGMGTVYEVEHSLLLDRRALKLIKFELAQEPGYRQRFFREAQWLNQSRHPHIVAVHDFQEDPDHGLFIVMELVRGANLKGLLQERGRLPYAEVLRIGREVALALQHVHRLGRVHRDVKPANILVEEDTGRAVVTDFGIAKDLGSSGEETLTQTHEVVGTLNYASPEQIGGDKDIIDERSDIYSLGAVLFEMYAGRHYGGIGSVSRLKYPEPPPDEFRTLVRGCLELDSERRVASATEVVQRLEACEQALHERDAAGTAAGTDSLAARVSSPPVADATAAATAVTRATEIATEVGSAVPPSPPSEGTTTIQQREAQDLRRQVLDAQVDELRQGIDGLRGHCLELQRHLSDFGISAAGFTALETLPDQLADIEREGDLERRRARLEVLADELAQGRTGIEAALVDAAAEETRTVAERLDQLAALGADFVPDSELEPVRTELAAARERFAARQWGEGRQRLAAATQTIENARAAQRTRAGDLVQQLFVAAARAIGELEALLPAGAELPSLEAARVETDALIARDQPAAARAAATGFVEDARARVADAAQKQRGELAALQSNLEDLQQRGVAERDIEDLRAQLRDAGAAFERRDWTSVARLSTATAAEIGRLEEAHQLAEEEKAARRAETEQTLQALLERAAAAPDELMAPARESARAVLEGQRPADFAAEMGALNRAIDGVQQTLAQESAYADLVVNRDRAIEARDALAAVEAPHADLEQVEGALQEAEDAGAQRRWQAAAAVYATASELALRLRDEHRQRQRRERVATARAGAEAARQRAADAEASLIAADLLQPAEENWRRAQRAEEQGELDEAAAQYARVATEFDAVAAAAEHAWSERLAQAEASLASSLAGAESEPAALVQVERDAAASRRDSAAGARLSERVAGLEDARDALDAAVAQRDAYDSAVAASAAATSAFERVGRLARADSELEEPRRFHEEAQAAFARRDWSGAARGFTRVVDDLDRLESDFIRREEREQAAAARGLAESARQRVDLDDAAVLVAPDAERAEELFRHAADTESAERFREAAERFGEAARAYQELARSLDEARHVERTAAEEVVGTALARAASLPAELAGATRAAAERLLGGVRPSGFAAELAALRESAAELDRVGDQLPVYEEALAARQGAAALRERVFAQAPKRKQRRTIEASLAAAAQAEKDGDWAEAVAGYGRMLAQLGELDSALRERKPGLPLAAIGAGAALAAGLGIALFVYQPWRTEVAPAPVAVAPKPQAPPAPAARPATSDQRPATGDQRPATGDKAATDDQQLATSDQRPTGGDQRPAVNHPPAISELNPKPDRPVLASVGDTVSLRATATDADDDPLTYSWTVDGKKVGENKPSLDVKVDGPHDIALTTSDGKAEDTQKWRIALSALKLDALPARLDRLRYDTSQEFALSPPRGQSAEGIKVAWSVDGQKMSDGPKFLFKADDPKYVRSAPVRVAATAANEQGQSFAREWKFSVQPPAPTIEKATPAGGEVTGDPGTPIQFELTASAPLGGQQIAYVFSVDGREQQKGTKASFTLTPADDRDVTVSAKLEDNFQQDSSAKTWKVKVSGIAGRAREWLDQYEKAFQAKDAAKLAALRGLSAGDVQKLERAFAAQNELEVSFNGAKVEPLEGNRSRVSYQMTQSFTGPDGRAQRSRSSCSHVLAVQDGRLTDTTQTPCSRLE